MRRHSSALKGPAPWGGNLVTRSRGASLTLLRRSGIDALPRLDFMSLMLGLQLCVYAAWQFFRFEPAGLSRPLVGDLFFVPLSALAVWSAWRASRRCLAGSRLRRGWLLIALGWVSWASGNAAQTVYEARGMVASPSVVAEVFYLAFIPLMFAGLLSFPSVARDRGERLRYLLDLAVVTLAGAAVVFYVVLSGDATAHEGGLLKAVSVVSPVGHLMILFGVASLLLRGTVPSARRALLLLVSAAFLYVVGGVVYGYVSVHGGYHGGDSVDSLYMVAVSLFVLAAAAQERVIEAERVAASNAQGNWLLLTAAIGGLATLLYAERHDGLFPTYTLMVIVAVMAALALLRQFLGRRDLGRALAQAEAANERARGAFEGAATGMALTDPAGTMLAANPAYAKMLGYSPSELVGMQLADLVHPDDRAMVAEVHKRMAAATETRRPGEFRHLRKDGEAIIGRVTVSPVRAEDGSLLHLLAEVEDVTELRRVEAELGESHELHRVMVDSSLDGLVVSNLDGTVRFVSPAAGDASGYRADELVGSYFLDFVHPDDQPAALATVAAALSGEPQSLLRVRLNVKDGSVKLWDVKIGVGRSLSGEPCFLVANMRDVTDQVELEEQFRQSQKMEAVGRLAGGVAHDFNNLLVGIRGYNELALLKIGDGPGSAEIGGSITASEKAAALTAQLLAYSRRQVLDPKVFDLRDAIAEMAALLRRTINGTIELVTTLPDQQAALVYADRSQIEQVLMNLSLNARDAMPSGGRLTIEVAVDAAEQQARMLVTDDGEGMDANTVAQIFEPFFSTKGAAGTGLGLSIVHGIVSQSGGQIAVESEPGQGTTIAVTLPLAEQEQTQAHTQTETPPLSHTRRGETVLLIEDDPIVRDVVSSMLTQRGYSLCVAASGEEAVVLAQTQPASFDIVVSDLVMPGLNGRQTAEAVCAYQPQARVLYISGYTDDQLVQVGGYEPGIAFLQKPFSIDELDGKMRELVDAIPV